MNILIICIQGMTSGVMAKRLNELASEKNENYHFKACGWSHVSENLKWSDVCLITPQARGYLDVIQPMLTTNKIRTILVKSTDLSFNRISDTYENILFLVRPVKESSTKDKIIDISFWLFSCFVIFFLIHLLSNFTTGFLRDSIFNPLNCATWQCISFYFCMIISRFVLKGTNSPRNISAMLGVYIVMLATPYAIPAGDSAYLYTSFLMRGTYGPKWSIYYILVTTLTTFCLRLLLKKDQEKNTRSKLNWLEMGFPISVLTCFFLGIRILISFVVN